MDDAPGAVWNLDYDRVFVARLNSAKSHGVCTAETDGYGQQEYQYKKPLRGLFFSFFAFVAACYSSNNSFQCDILQYDMLFSK